MRRKLLGTIALVCIISLSASGQTGVFGKWKTIDDETGEAKSIVEIYEKEGKVYGKIVELFRKKGEDPDPICNKCDDDDPRKGEKIIGMEILKNMEKDGDEYSGGKILKPDEGNIYRCKIWTENGKLYVRGYLGFFYRTQTWVRP